MLLNYQVAPDHQFGMYAMHPVQDKAKVEPLTAIPIHWYLGLLHNHPIAQQKLDIAKARSKTTIYSQMHSALHAAW
ncbi:hypothetical protein D3C75_1244550 [compost metagenome]